MNSEHVEQVRILEADVKHLEDRFDGHLAIYANNGKESARVASALERIERHSFERDKKVDEMFDAYQGFKIGKMGITWLFGLFMAVGGGILLVKEIMKK